MPEEILIHTVTTVTLTVWSDGRIMVALPHFAG